MQNKQKKLKAIKMSSIHTKLCLGLIFSLALSLSTRIYAQQDSTQNTSILSQTDSTKQKGDQKIPKKKRSKARPNHSPQKALIWGIIPGGGQIYNKKYWKLPIVYGGIGALGYLVVDSRVKYQCFRKSYLAMVDLDSTTTNTCDPLLSSSQLKIRRDYYLQQFEYATLGFVGFYVLTLVDAFVDAHLMKFDISDDLSFEWQPNLQLNAFSPSQSVQAGIQMRISLKPKAKQLAVFEF
jgi:hypothetical protein